MRRAGPSRTTNKGFARRPQEFLRWEEGDWEEEWVRYVAGGRRWEWRGGASWLGRIWRVRRAGPSRTTNKGFARRPQEFLGWEQGDWEEEWGVGVARRRVLAWEEWAWEKEWAR